MADIVCTEIKKAYGGNIVFDGFSHTFGEGGKTVISGASGCGKTTLLRLIAGLERPDSGIISGADIKSCAYSFSDDRLFENFSALENVACVIPHKSRSERMKTAERLLLELGIESGSLGEHVVGYSGGMKRRVSLARALAAKRPVILLDEPFNGLDHSTRDNAIGLTAKYTSGKTLIVVTHSSYERDSIGGEPLELG